MGGPPKSLLDAIRSTMQPHGGRQRPTRTWSPQEVLSSIEEKWPGQWSNASVIDVAKAMDWFYGPGTREPKRQETLHISIVSSDGVRRESDTPVTFPSEKAIHALLMEPDYATSVTVTKPNGLVVVHTLSPEEH